MGQDDRPLSHGEFNERIYATKADKRRRRQKLEEKQRKATNATKHDGASKHQR